MKIHYSPSKLLPFCGIAFALLVSLVAHTQAQLRSVEEKLEESLSQMTLDENGAIPPVHPDAPLTSKMSLLLNALTVDEKISLVHGDADPDLPESLGQVGYLPGVPRLGVPERRDADALGIEVAAESTAPPTRLGLAATFDRAAAYALGQLEGKEGRALGVDLIYAPMVDLMRQPNWARNNTAFGEDPFLCGQLGIEEVRGIQSEGLMAMVKHYGIYHGQAGVEGGSIPGEPSLPTVVDERTARELYLRPFEYIIIESHPASVMASYQGFKIDPRQETPLWATDNPFTLETILREEWDFCGFVLSDYGATHSVHALLSGLDQDYPGWSFFGFFQYAHYQDDLKPLVDPTSSSYDPLYAAALDDAVARVLYGYERFGLLEVSPAPRPNMSDLKDDHAEITELLSEQSAVLLKNKGRVLPLKGSDLKSVAVIGPTGRQVMANGGQYERSRGFSDRVAISPFQMLQELAPANANFTFAPGIDWIGSVVPASALPGGLQRTQSDSNAVRTDATIDYGSSSGQNDLTSGVTYTWTGTLVVPADDTYYLWLQHSFGISRLRPFFTSLSIDGTAREFFRPGVPAGTYAAYSPDPAANILANGANSGVAIHLTAGSHTITITLEVPERAEIPITYPVSGPPLTSPPAFRFTWSRLSDTLNAAVAAARSAKVALVFADDNGANDEALVNSLAANQDALIEAVAEANPNTVVVLSTGGPVLMPWLQDVKAVLQMWYPGQEGGTSTAKLLLGQVTPGGKLPFTWPADEAQTPFAGHPERITGDGTQVVFSEGLFMGYRWYDAEGIEPLFPFGHGLSYTKFRYSHLDIQPKVVKDKGKKDKNTKKPSGNDDGIIRVSFRVTNTGNRAGAEIAQLYVAPINPPVERPLKELKGFEKVFLKPGESKKVTINLDRRSLAYYNVEAGAWDVARGRYGILVSSSSQNIELQGDLVNMSASSLSVTDSTPVPGATKADQDVASSGASARTETTAAGAPTLTVDDGSGSGAYDPGEIVTVTADPPPPGKEFAGWSGDTQILANPFEATTTATMPSINVTITATYADAPSSEQPE